MPREPPRQVLVRVGALLGRALQSAIHNTEGGYEVLVRARGRGRVVALRRSEPPVRPGRRALGLAEELLQPVVAKLPREVPQPEHVVEEIVHRGPSRRVVSGPRAGAPPGVPCPPDGHPARAPPCVGRAAPP